MPWIEISLRVRREAVDEAEAALLRHGALAITLLDDADRPVLEPGPGETPLWPSVEVRGLFETTVDPAGVISGVQDIGRPDGIRWRTVEDRDWERAWMDRFRPMRFGRRLWIVPTGMAIEPSPDQVEISLDPGLAFGTGTHPTTALCLEWLDGQDLAGLRVVDYGCGSGVLGIAAARLGAEQVVCVDTDPQALEATAVNAERNGVAGRLSCLPPESFRERRADAVLANILAAPLVELAPIIAGCALAGAPVVLSGLLAEQGGAVERAYRPWCERLGQSEKEGWLRLDLRRAT